MSDKKEDIRTRSNGTRTRSGILSKGPTSKSESAPKQSIADEDGVDESLQQVQRREAKIVVSQWGQHDDNLNPSDQPVSRRRQPLAKETTTKAAARTIATGTGNSNSAVPNPDPSSSNQISKQRQRQRGRRSQPVESNPNTNRPTAEATTPTPTPTPPLTWKQRMGLEMDIDEQAEQLAVRLQHASEVLLDKLFAYLSQLPEEGSSNQNSDSNNNVSSSNDSTTTAGASSVPGMTLPAAAVGWLSSQLYPSEGNEDEADDDLSTEFLDNGTGTLWMGVAMRDRLSLLRFLLPRVTHVRLTRQIWPPDLPKDKKKHATTGSQNYRYHQRGNNNDHSPRQRTRMANDRRTGGRNRPPREVVNSSTSVCSALTIESIRDEPPTRDMFLKYMNKLLNHPRIDMRVFPNTTALVLEGIPPTWIVHLSSLQDSLQVFCVRKAGLYHLPSLFVPKVEEEEQQQQQKQRRRRRRQVRSPSRNGDDPTAVAVPAPPSIKYSRLTHCKLDYCSIGEMTSLSAAFKFLAHVQSLSLAHNDIMTEQTALRGLKDLTYLSKLNLSYNQIVALPHANQYLGQVTVLYLSNNRITTSKGLDRLYALVELWLDNNQIDDLSELAGLGRLPQLQKLYLRGNPITKQKQLSSSSSSSSSSSYYRKQVLGWFFQERRCTYRHELPILDGIAVSEKEWMELQEESFIFTPIGDATTTTTTTTPSTEISRNLLLRNDNEEESGRQQRQQSESTTKLTTMTTTTTIHNSDKITGLYTDSNSIEHSMVDPTISTFGPTRNRRVIRIRKAQRAMIYDGIEDHHSIHNNNRHENKNVMMTTTTPTVVKKGKRQTTKGKKGRRLPNRKTTGSKTTRRDQNRPTGSSSDFSKKKNKEDKYEEEKEQDFAEKKMAPLPPDTKDDYFKTSSSSSALLSTSSPVGFSIHDVLVSLQDPILLEMKQKMNNYTSTTTDNGNNDDGMTAGKGAMDGDMSSTARTSRNNIKKKMAVLSPSLVSKSALNGKNNDNGPRQGKDDEKNDNDETIDITDKQKKDDSISKFRAVPIPKEWLLEVNISEMTLNTNAQSTTTAASEEELPEYNDGDDDDKDDDKDRDSADGKQDKIEKDIFGNVDTLLSPLNDSETNDNEKVMVSDEKQAEGKVSLQIETPVPVFDDEIRSDSPTAALRTPTASEPTPKTKPKVGTVKLKNNASRPFSIFHADWDDLVILAKAGMIPDGKVRTPILPTPQQEVENRNNQGGSSRKIHTPDATNVLGPPTGSTTSGGADLSVPTYDASNDDSQPSLGIDDEDALSESNTLPHLVLPDDLSVPSSLGTNREDFPKLNKFQLAEDNAVYDGPESCQDLNVLQNIDLYFSSYVFPDSLPELDKEFSIEKMKEDESWKLVAYKYPRLQLWTEDRRWLESNLNPSSSSGVPNEQQHLPSWSMNRERFVRAWEEDVVPCGKPALRRLAPNKRTRLGFHGEKQFKDSAPDLYAECRKVFLCISSAALYVVLRNDTVTENQQSQIQGRKKRFPLPIPDDLSFQDAPWPHAVARHSFQDLRAITIGFEFQRLILRFDNPAMPKHSDPFVYALLTSNKRKTVELLQEIQKLAKETNEEQQTDLTASDVAIENDSQLVFDAMAVAISPKPLGTVMHYQLVQQRWKRGDRGTVRRVCVVTETSLFLLNEDYAADGHQNLDSSWTSNQLADPSFTVVDEASLSQVAEVQAANADPKAITIIINPMSRLSRIHRWRLICRDSDGAERLVDDVRKAISIHNDDDDVIGDSTVSVSLTD